MWPSKWRRSIVRTKPNTIKYDAQKSGRKKSLFVLKKEAEGGDLSIVQEDAKEPTLCRAYKEKTHTSQKAALSAIDTSSLVFEEHTTEHSNIKGSKRNMLRSVRNSTTMPTSRPPSNIGERICSLLQPEFVVNSGRSKVAPISRTGKVTSVSTLDGLVEALVNDGDFRFISDFFITYRLFMSPVQLCKLLNFRFMDSLEADSLAAYNTRNQIQVIITYWLEQYFDFDFVPCAALRFTLGNFLQTARTHLCITSSSIDTDIVERMCKVYKCLRQTLRKPSNASSTREKRHHKELLHKCSFDSIIHSRSNSLKESRHNPSHLMSSHSAMKPPDENSLSQWTMKMVCGLASLKSQLPEVYDSLISGSSHQNNRGTTSSSLTNNSQPVDNVPKPISNPRREHSFLFLYSTETIAQQFCIIEQRCLCAVEWHELVEVHWKNRADKASSAKCPGVLGQIDRFNIMCQWVASEIVTCENMEVRVRAVEKLIRIAMRCYQHRNYSTLLQILLGLQSSDVSRLSQTWRRVGTREKRTFEELKKLTSPCKNWSNIRSAMHDSSEDYRSIMWSKSERPDCKIVGEACIPFFGLFLSDLTYNSELPSHIPAASQDSPRLINFRKHRITASVIKWLLTFQALSRRYPFLPDVSVFPKCVFLNHLNDTEIRQLSARCE